MKPKFQALIFLCSVLALAACSGPAPAAKAEPKVEEPQPQITQKSSVETPAPAAPAEREPARVKHQEVAPRVKAAAPAKSNAPTQTATATASTTSNSSAPAPGTLTLPAPVGPTIAEPAPPPPADEKPIQPAPEPAPRQVRVPSGTIVAVRMIDSVDSGTAHVGETFKASLDQPVVVDNETVFPKGSEVYVKLAKLESAGRISGRSEIQLQLERIFLGKKSYMVESNPFTSTGASQGAKTAKTAGLGAAIGAAIGAISGGGKGAIIGGATGAGAGVGVEAIRKGEQVRVDSETRLDFRLEEPIEVTVSSSLNTQPRSNPSGPMRFGTRQQ